MNVFYKAFVDSSKDIKFLYVLVFLRLFSYSMSNQVIVFFFKDLGVSDNQIGTFMALTLLGDVFISYLLTWYADFLKRKNVLIYGALMMFASGAIFCYFENYYVLLLAAIIGVVSSGDEVGPFKSIEESMIAHLTPHHERPEVYSLHSLFGTIGASLGSIVCGSFIDYLMRKGIVKSYLTTYKIVFLLYGVIGLVKLGFIIGLSERTNFNFDHDISVDPEQEPLISSGVAEEISNVQELEQVGKVQNDSPLQKLEPNPENTISIMKKLLVCFMLDSFAYGITSNWLLYYYETTFSLSFTQLGLLFSITKVVTAVSVFPSSMIARLFGPVKATLLVQITSSVFFMIIPFLSSFISLSIGSLNIYYATTAMDVTPRQILLTNIIASQDLTRIMGIVNVGKTFARCVGQFLSGFLVEYHYLWLCFVLTGGITILADILLGIMFLPIDKRIVESMQR